MNPSHHLEESQEAGQRTLLTVGWSFNTVFHTKKSEISCYREKSHFWPLPLPWLLSITRLATQKSPLGTGVLTTWVESKLVQIYFRVLSKSFDRHSSKVAFQTMRNWSQAEKVPGATEQLSRLTVAEKQRVHKAPEDAAGVGGQVFVYNTIELC